MRPTSRRLLTIAAPLTFLLAGCASDAPQDSLEPAGPFAREIDELSNPVFLIAIVVFFLVQALVLVTIVRWRRRPGDETMPEQVHGNTRLEIGWTIAPALLLGAIGIITVPKIFDGAEPVGGRDVLEVQVTGQKYWWGYTYGEQPDLGIETEFVTANELHIPAGRPVLLELRSRDVIHSFWAPKLNGKRDVVPGRVHTWNLEADEPGVYSGQCAEFCGTSHANMRLKVVAHDAESWQDWLDVMQGEPDEPTGGMAAEGAELFSAKGCAGCHTVKGQFETVSDDAVPAPDLTHLFTRDCFAGCLYDLTDRNELEAWLRDPQRKAGSLMRIGELTEAEIDRLYEYLRTLE